MKCKPKQITLDKGIQFKFTIQSTQIRPYFGDALWKSSSSQENMRMKKN